MRPLWVAGSDRSKKHSVPPGLEAVLLCSPGWQGPRGRGSAWGGGHAGGSASRTLQTALPLRSELG